MRRAAAVGLAALLAACATPTGEPVQQCDAQWRNVDPLILVEGEGPVEPVPIECMRESGLRRIRIGFRLPPGPDCHRLASVDVVESADAVSVTLGLAPVPEGAGGACPDEATRVTTQIDLADEVGNRTLLDGSRAGD